MQQHPDITMDTRLTPEIVDVFKAITGLLTWRTTDNSVLQLAWEAPQQVRGCMKAGAKVLWIGVMKDGPLLYIRWLKELPVQPIQGDSDRG